MIFGSDAKISRTKKNTKKEDWLSDVEHVVGGTISRHNVPHTVPHELRLLRTTTHSSSCALFFSSAPSRPCGRLPSAETADAAMRQPALRDVAFHPDCDEVSGACPATCRTMLETTLDAACAGKYFTDTDEINGVDVDVAKPWDTEKAHFLISFR